MHVLLRWFRALGGGVVSSRTLIRTGAGFGFAAHASAAKPAGAAFHELVEHSGFYPFSSEGKRRPVRRAALHGRRNWRPNAWVNIPAPGDRASSCRLEPSGSLVGCASHEFGAPGPGVYRARSSRGRAFQRHGAKIGRLQDEAATLHIGSRLGPH